MPPIRSARSTKSSSRRRIATRGTELHSVETAEEPQLFEPCMEDALKLGESHRTVYNQALPPWEVIIPKQLRHLIPADPRPPPLQLQDFEVFKTLGSGGYGKVLLAKTRRMEHKWDRPGSVLALKSIQSRDLRGADMKHSREKDLERLSLGSLPWSPWINNVYGAFFDHRNLYLSLDYVQGFDLHSIIYNHGPISCKTAAFYFANIICGLEFLHEHGVAHNDLKPDNIIAGADGYLVIADFSTGKRMETDYELLGQEDFIAGTYSYLAPEQIDPRGQTGVIARGIDLWQAGTILYEMICRRKAFPGSNELQVRHNIAKCKWKWPEGVHIGKNLDDLVKGLFIKDGGKRLGAREEGGDIEEVMHHPWLAHVDWEKMRHRLYLAPRLPPVEDPETTWHKEPLPKPRECPGVRLIAPKSYLRFDKRIWSRK